MTGVVEVPVGGSDRPALIDEVFAERVLRYRWRLWWNPRSGRINGVQATINGKSVLLHRYVMGLAGSTPAVDHINRDVLDNRHNNLRMATASQNMANTLVSRHSESGFKGVTRDRKSGLWKAQIYADKRRINVGMFHNKAAAARAYDDAARVHHGGFGRYNFPLPGERSALEKGTHSPKLRPRLKDLEAVSRG